MFNPEKILGSMLRSGMRGRGIGSLVSGGAALGLLGVAMEAVEHFANKSQATGPATPPVPPSAQSRGLPPRAPADGAPPPPPGAAAAPPPPPGTGAAPAPPAQGGAEAADDAVLLIRAMIAAANADGVIDAEERGRIMEQLQSVDLTQEEHRFIVHELLAPKEMQSIVGDVKTREMARQVYAASLLAITVDTDAERRYLSDLAEQMGLDAGSIESIHRQLGRQD